MPDDVVIVEENVTPEAPAQPASQDVPPVVTEPVQKQYKDPKTHTPPVGSEKWNKVYKGFRQNEKAQEENQALKDEMGEMKSMMKTLIETQAQNSKKSELESLTKKIEQAYQDGNTEEVVRLNTEYLNNSTAKAPVVEQPNPVQPSANEVSMEHQVAATIFQQSNDWYGQDETLSLGLNGFMNTINNEQDYYSAPPQVRLNEAKRRLKLMYPQSPHFVNESQPIMGVGQVGNGQQAVNTSKITITRAEINSAKMFMPASSEKQVIEALTKQKRGEL